MNQRSKQRFKTIILITITLILLTKPLGILAEGDYIIVRVVDAEYPPLTGIFTESNQTMFEFDIQIEIENPTNSNVEASYVCAPFPYPVMSTVLDDKNITAVVSVNHEW
ncbi:hypothetical protein EU534_01350, partial [Candidatus Heimdallarchaeota archaeon]